MSFSDSITSLKAKYASGETTPNTAIEQLASSIASSNPEVGAYLSYDLEAALKEASSADLSLPLGGIPIAIKDNINVKGQPCTCASKFFEGAYTSPYDATVISKLRAAGAIPFGRVNLDEFAMGSATENSALGTTINPAAPGYIPGGSSGGSAAAVSANIAIAALGSDTGGSIRQPASHCGIVGLKPSYGRVSRYGLVAFASSLDQIGPMTKTVEDSALMLNFMCGVDTQDSTSLKADVPDFTAKLKDGVKGMKIGLPKEYFGDGIDPKVRDIIMASAKRLEDQGAELIEVSLPHTEYAIATYYIIAPAEASSNLSRFDGIRYGNRKANDKNILDVYNESRESGFGPEVKRRIILGTYVLSSGYYDAYYTQAQKIRTLIKQDFDEAFKNVDLLLSPIAPSPPRKQGENAEDPLTEYLADIFTISANLSGVCGISVPAGTVEKDGANLPIGVQLLGPHLGEETLLQAAYAVELK